MTWHGGGAGWRAGQQVEVWLHAFDRGSVVPERCVRDLLGSEEVARADAFVHAADRQSYLRSRVFLRRVLSRQTGVAPERFAFRQQPDGKPLVEAPTTLRNLAFNLSHTEGLLACAVSRHRQVALGIDAEAISHEVEWLMTSPRVLSKAERDQLGRYACATERRKRFFALWTLKEAYSKACGRGLAMDFSKLSFQVTPRAVRLHSPSVENGHWLFFQAQPTPWHQLALAMTTPCAMPFVVNVHWLCDTGLGLGHH